MKHAARRSGGRRAAPPPTTRVKIAISLPREQVAAAQRAVDAGRAASVSAYISQALEIQGSSGALTELVASMRAEDGAPSAADYAWADAVLGIRNGRGKPGRKRRAQ